MTFNSLAFLIFLLIFFTLWKFLKNFTRPRLWLILIASMVFYGWWDWRFLFLIFFTGSIDFFLALGIKRSFAIANEKRRKLIARLLLTFSLITGLGVLSIFKYSTLFAGWISSFLALFGLHIQLADHIPEFCLILPVGISFYTFQSLSYTIDVYRGKLEPTRSFVHYMAYLMLFPQLVAGPIVRAVDLLPRLLQIPCTSPMIRYNALKMILLGFFKKCVLADNAALFVNTAFTNTYVHTGSATWLLVMAMFSIQIYCDFSGYSDIARGIIKFMGYRFNLNFNHPYAACGLRDFWSRWHISLSTWFRDYVYIPLGGNRKGELRTHANLFLTFLISGLWHGAAVNFLVWGAYHGCIQIAEKVSGLTRYLSRCASPLIMGFFILLTQLEVLIGWIFFRAASFGEAFHVIKHLFAFTPEQIELKTPIDIAPWTIFVPFLLMELALIFRVDQKLLHHSSAYRKLEPFLLGCLGLITVTCRGGDHGFIYFQF